LNKLNPILWLTFSVGLSAQVTLGPTVSGFEVLAGSTVTNTGATAVTGGSVGVSAGSAITGFPPGTVTGGALHAADAVAAQAQSDLTTDFGVAAGLTCPGGNNLTGQNLGGLTLTPGVYCFSTSAQLTGILTLDAQGNQNAQFVFQTGSTLTTASGSSVLLINSANAGNVFWEVGSSATLGTGTAFIGNIMAQSSITLTTGASLNGRALARVGAVTLDSNAISFPAVGNGGGGGGGGNGPPGTPAPSSLILVSLALAGVAIYQLRARTKRS
jgi:type VI secretion system secreted protein VgrG